jgi:hypothetical protein
VSIHRDEEAQPTGERLIRAFDEVMFAATQIQLAVDNSRPGDLSALERRELKRAAEHFLAEADRLMTWWTEARNHQPAN